MKRIKNRLCKIVVATAMILSGCFITQTVEAVDDSSTRSENYFTNNLVVESDGIVGNSNYKGDKPDFEMSTDDKGSNLTSDATEGQVWTNKIIKKVEGQDGLYEITFQALGFKYRYVNEDNEKENNIWKNPLKAGTSLSITEEIDKNFHVIENDDLYKMEATTKIGVSNVSFTENNGKVELIIEANNVTGFDKEHSDGFKYTNQIGADELKGIAFDVEATFYVRVNSDVNEGTYETKDANSQFIPAEDNFYYYEWGSSIDKTTYGYDAINWNNSETGMGGIVNVQNIEIPSGVKGKTILFSIGNQGENKIDHPSDYQKGPGNYIDGTPEKSDNNYYYIDVKDRLNLQWDELKIKNLYFYWYAVKGSGQKKQAFMRIEIEYDDNSWIVFTPINKLNNNGGNEPAGDFWAETIITKNEPSIRKDYDPDGDGIINEKFTNHGKIVLRKLSDNDLQAKKSVELKDWDERTYKIDLYASHKIMPKNKVANIMLMLDVSGSMPWFVTAPTGTHTNLQALNDSNTAKDNETLGKNNGLGTIKEWEYTYYVYRLGEGDSYEYKPIAYTDGTKAVPVGTNKTEKLSPGWYTVKSDSNGKKVFQKDEYKDGKISVQGSVLANETIYTRNSEVDKTKLEALYIALDYFIKNMISVSPESNIAYVQFAAGVKNFSDFENVKNITADAIINNVNTKLYGGTNQYAAIEKANQIIADAQSDQNNNISKENTYAILFTDGDLSEKNLKTNTTNEYYTVDDVTDIANTMKSEYVNLLFGAGIFAQLDNGQDNAGVTSLKQWVSNDPIDNTSKLVYIGKNSDELINEFSEIFGKIIYQITNADIIDYIDSRFIITDEDGEKLNPSDKFAGGTIGYDKTKEEYYIIWEDVNLSYSVDGLTGWHQTIYVKAKDDYIGGNDVTTNGSGSGINVGTIHKEFNQPEVNVKVDFVVGNADDTIFLGESLSVNTGDSESIEDRLFNQFKNSKGETLSIAPDGTELTKDDFEFTWYSASDGLSALENSKINDINAEKPTNDKVYYLQVKLKNVEISSQDSLSNTDDKDNVLLKTIYATNDMDQDSKQVGEGLDQNNNKIDDFATARSKYGVYVVDVVSGSITIYKEIDEMTNNDTQGDPIFTFHIVGTSDAGTPVNEYRSVRFEKDSDAKQFVATIDGLEKGNYTVTELDSIRYQLSTLTEENIDSSIEYAAGYTIQDNSVICQIGTAYDNKVYTDCRNVKITFKNTNINDKDQSDTDIVINTFNINDDGSITITGKHDHFVEVGNIEE